MNHPELDIAQLLIVRSPAGLDVMAKSESIEFVHEEFARRTAAALGVIPADPRHATFAWPMTKNVMSVGTLIVQPQRPPAMRFLFIHQELYGWIGDPFEITDRFPANIDARGHLPLLRWPDEPRPLRAVENLQSILKAGDSALLLGATQALLDGVKVRLSVANASSIRKVWSLLPDSSRAELWPCEFTSRNDLAFHIAAMPEVPAKPDLGIIGEEKAKDYPEGRYELALQVAVEAGDQTAVNVLLARKSPQDVLRMALWMLLIAAGTAIALNWFK